MFSRVEEIKPNMLDDHLFYETVLEYQSQHGIQ